ncbi:hypothetical protein [Vibrio phage vB_VpaP_SJSY21]|nr:hypothetical protein [Vibrio phage vB_VpaP_SJSY21]
MLRCPNCGETHFCYIPDFKTIEGSEHSVIICDGCGATYKEPEDYTNNLNGTWSKKDGSS